MENRPPGPEKISSNDPSESKASKVYQESPSGELVVPVQLMGEMEVEICLLEEVGR